MDGHFLFQNGTIGNGGTIGNRRTIGNGGTLGNGHSVRCCFIGGVATLPI